MRDVSLREFLTTGEPILTDSLEPAVLMSLFSDLRVDGHGGWWGHAVGPAFGSRLWTLSRAKPTQETLKRAELYAKEALDWLVKDGLARQIEVRARFRGEQLLLSLRIDNRTMEVTNDGFSPSFTG